MAWEQLLSIREQQQADAEFAAERRADPPACPVDGWPLREGPNGELECPFGGHLVERT